MCLAFALRVLFSERPSARWTSSVVYDLWARTLQEASCWLCALEASFMCTEMNGRCAVLLHTVHSFQQWLNMRHTWWTAPKVWHEEMLKQHVPHTFRAKPASGSSKLLNTCTADQYHTHTQLWFLHYFSSRLPNPRTMATFKSLGQIVEYHRQERESKEILTKIKTGSFLNIGKIYKGQLEICSLICTSHPTSLKVVLWAWENLPTLFLICI